MVGKNNEYLKEIKSGTKVEKYSIKKLKVGTASVMIGASIFLGMGAVAQAEDVATEGTTAPAGQSGSEGEQPVQSKEQPVQPKEQPQTTPEKPTERVVERAVAETPKLDKTQLENYVNEITAKLEAGKYANKTLESLELLRSKLSEARAVLGTAKDQKDLKKAYYGLFTLVNSGLKNKPAEKETPAVDTTGGKPTVGKKAENTEPSAANSHAIPANAEVGSGFRRNDSGAPQVTNTVDYRDA